jgi:hypothetical protein
MTLSCGHAYVGYYHEGDAEVTCSICKSRSVILTGSIGDRVGIQTKSEVDYETEYLKLYKHLDRIRAALGIAPYPDGGLNPFEVCETLVGLMSRIAELQRAATVNVPTRPSDGRPWGIDYNGLVHLIKSLVKS